MSDDMRQQKPGEVKGGSNKKKQDRVNPFEIRKSKKAHFHAMNEKKRGNVTRSSAAQSTGQSKRQKQLLREFQSRGKQSVFTDRRLGEAGHSNRGDDSGEQLTVEDKIELRLRRVREQKARSMFSIDDDVSLSHMGQSLSGADLSDPLFFQVGEDDDFGGDGGLLDPDIVHALHFGGGEEEARKSNKKKSKREIMQQIIAKSKVAKYERQAEREQLSLLSSKLDSEFEDVADLLDMKPRKKKKNRRIKEAEFVPEERDEEAQEQRGPLDDYDRLVALMRDEERSARAGKRLRTEEEIAKGRLEYMKQREVLRLDRMQGDATHDQEEEDTGFQGEDAEDEDEDAFAEVIKGRVWRREDDEEYSSGIDEDDSSIPFLINMPRELEEFEQLMELHRDKRHIVLSRMISLHHPSLKPQHTEDLLRLQLFVLVSLLQCTHDPQEALAWAHIAARVCNRILRVVPSAATKQQHPLDASSFFYPYRLLLASACAGGPPPPRQPTEHALYAELRALAVVQGSWGSLMLLCVVFPRLFPFSDASHPLASPALMHLCALLMRAHSSHKQLAQSLFVCDALLPLLGDADRLAPEPLAFLGSLSGHSRSFVTASVPDVAPEFSSMAGALLHGYAELWRRVSPESLHATALPEVLKQPAYSLPVMRLREHKPLPVKTYEPLVARSDKFSQMRKVKQQLRRETRAAARELKRDREFLNAAKLEEYQVETESRAQSLKGIVGFLQDQAGEEKQLKRIKQQQLKM